MIVVAITAMAEDIVEIHTDPPQFKSIVCSHIAVQNINGKE